MPIQDTSYQLAPSSQARADAQISNPATPITATKSLEATQTVDPLKTANPDNGGITPATQTTEKPASFDVSSLSRGLKNFDIWVYNTMIAADKSQSSNELTKWYGIDLGWYTAEEAQTWFQNTMSDPNDPNIIYWKILTRKSNGWDKTLQAKFIRDIQQVDMDKKQANSGAWVNPDLWLDRGSTMDLANLFTQSDILKNKKLNEAWDVDKFILAFNNFKTYDYINIQDNHLIRFHNLQGKKKVSEENKYSMNDFLGELMTVNNHILFIDTPPVPGTPVFTTTDPDTITTQG